MLGWKWRDVGSLLSTSLLVCRPIRRGTCPLKADSVLLCNATPLDNRPAFVVVVKCTCTRLQFFVFFVVMKLSTERTLNENAYFNDRENPTIWRSHMVDLSQESALEQHVFLTQTGVFLGDMRWVSSSEGAMDSRTSTNSASRPLSSSLSCRCCWKRRNISTCMSRIWRCDCRRSAMRAVAKPCASMGTNGN